MKRYAFVAVCLAAGILPGTAVRGLMTATDADGQSSAVVEAALARLQQLGREGIGNAAAAEAWQQLTAAGGAAFFPILRAVREDQPIVANWLRTALDAIVEQERRAGRTLPADQLEAFVLDRRHAPRARLWAYEWLVQVRPEARQRLLPSSLDDPSLELRRLAIEYQLEILERSGRPEIRSELEKLFAYSRDRDQVESLVRKIEAAGGQADITRHFGLLTRLELLGPWDAPASQGYSQTYPPEKEPLAAGPFPGKNNLQLRWQPAESIDRYALFDLNKILGKHKDAVVFARAILRAPQPTPCQIRVTSPTSVKIFLNGDFLFGRDEYHHGANFDAHTASATLRQGDNVLIVKVCQNNQQESWAQAWQVQVRVCDSTGGAIASLQQVWTRNGQTELLPLGARRQAAPEREK